LSQSLKPQSIIRSGQEVGWLGLGQAEEARNLHKQTSGEIKNILHSESR